MDISLLEFNGLHASAKLKRVASAIKILPVIRRIATAYLNELQRAGVFGCVWSVKRAFYRLS